MFEYAIRKKYLTENPMDKVQILVKFKQVIRKTGKTETYNSDELKDLNQYLDCMYTETEDTAFLAIKLNFLLGLRVGELVALKWDDYININHLHIVREEVRNQVTNQYEVVEHTKTNRDRFVVLVPKAINILQKIERTGDYIFMRGGERLTSRQIAYVLEKYAERQGLSTKSTHKMRKTFASNLNASGVPLDCIRELLGHSNLNTTLGYIYNPLTEKETYDLISKAL
jgi:integrase